MGTLSYNAKFLNLGDFVLFFFFNLMLGNNGRWILMKPLVKKKDIIEITGINY